MKPGNDNDFVTDLHSIQVLCVRWNHLQKGIGRTRSV